MPALSEANYLSRRVKLQQAISAAQQQHQSAAFDLELGEGSEDTLTSAKAELSTLESRLEGLDAAWARRKLEIAREKDEEQIQARTAAVAAVDRLLKDRKKAATKLEQAAASLIASYADFQANGRAILDAVRPVVQYLGRDGFDHLRIEATGDFGSPAYLVAGMLENGGLDFDGIDTGAAAARVKSQGIEAFVAAHSENIRRRVRDLAPADDE